MVLKNKPKQLSQDQQKVRELLLKPVAATKTHLKIYVFVSKTKIPWHYNKLQVIVVPNTTSDRRLLKTP